MCDEISYWDDLESDREHIENVHLDDSFDSGDDSEILEDIRVELDKLRQELNKSVIELLELFLVTTTILCVAIVALFILLLW